MITSSWPRLVIGTILLFIGAATGVMAWAVETCIGGSADSLVTGIVTLGANLLAWALLITRVPVKLVLFVAILPALAAVIYTGSTADFALGYLREGQSACAFLTADRGFEQDGREPQFILLWLVVCLSFWLGLLPIIARSIRVWKDSHK